ncbi:MAG: glutamine-hydrolyzing carbamoyl-phosphate synthase small subunit [Flavobacteriaceae bacterium]|nr:glutamine-hydrolyzing carbamoyl-phosphate synthase small subunit [Flavobacteriaceae bacterium]MDG2235710.1 glutamine-hydrolyzing carbamoyl-phosphate synthase small subunit [Flavobacteriaceae bacterium]
MEYRSKKKAFVLLADGTQFFGKSIGIEGSAFGEICFNTGMTGYQEIFTDPSYFGQLMVTTNTHIGNYGVLNQESQSKTISISGLICKDFSFNYSRPSGDQSLYNYLKRHELVTISDVDTRALVNYIREHGAMNAVISTEVGAEERLLKELLDTPSMVGLDLASKVSTKEAYTVGNPDAEYKVATLDLGIKQNILNHMIERDIFVKVFPYNTSFDELESWNPDGYFISNGPGDPEPLKEAQALAKAIIDKNKPLFGICLGHQIIALANGIPTFKMFNGHRGINHPVKNLLTGKGEITSQNHGFAVDLDVAKAHPEIEVTHVHLNDGTLAGMRMKNNKCFSVQYHPEAGPGPNDATYLFDIFKEYINN